MRDDRDPGGRRGVSGADLFAFYPRLRGLVRGLMRSPTFRRISDRVDHSSIVHSIMVKAIDHAGRRPAVPIRNPMGWFRAIARNLLFDAMRRDMRMKPYPPSSGKPPEDRPSDTPSPSGRLLKAEQYRIMESAIARLSEDEQRVLELFYREGRSRREIAAALGRSEDAIGGLLKRAKGKLKTLLSGRGVLPDD